MGPAPAEFRTYPLTQVVTFRKTTDQFGGLSNMAPGFPLEINGTKIRTAEALYQACRFPHMPHVQHMIISETSPMTAKMRSKPHREVTRSDWVSIRVPIMKWCLRIKLVQNWEKFGNLLLMTGNRPIVERSAKDDFWGARTSTNDLLCGMNVLGRLLMELRQKLIDDPLSLHEIPPVPIENFLLLGHNIPTIKLVADESSASEIGKLNMSLW